MNPVLRVRNRTYGRAALFRRHGVGGFHFRRASFQIIGKALPPAAVVGMTDLGHAAVPFRQVSQILGFFHAPGPYGFAECHGQQPEILRQVKIPFFRVLPAAGIFFVSRRHDRLPLCGCSPESRPEAATVRIRSGAPSEPSALSGRPVRLPQAPCARGPAPCVPASSASRGRDGFLLCAARRQAQRRFPCSASPQPPARTPRVRDR